MPVAVQDLVHTHGRNGESFSATVARLIELGLRADRSPDQVTDLENCLGLTSDEGNSEF